MTLRVLERMRMQHWGRLLKRHELDTSRSRCILHPLDYKLGDGQKVEYSLNELVQCCTEEERIIFLIHDYQSFCNDLLLSNDEITVTICNFMNTANDFALYNDSTKVGDSIAM